MEWEIAVAPIARKKLAKIPEPDRRRLLAAIGNLQDGLIGDIKPLTDRDEWRLRVGGWRVVFSADEETHVIRVKRVGVRGDVYKD